MMLQYANAIKDKYTVEMKCVRVSTDSKINKCKNKCFDGNLMKIYFSINAGIKELMCYRSIMDIEFA